MQFSLFLFFYSDGWYWIASCVISSNLSTRVNKIRHGVINTVDIGQRSTQVPCNAVNLKQGAADTHEHGSLRSSSSTTRIVLAIQRPPTVFLKTNHTSHPILARSTTECKIKPGPKFPPGMVQHILSAKMLPLADHFIFHNRNCAQYSLLFEIIQLKNKNYLHTRNGKEPIKTNPLRQRLSKQSNNRKISMIFTLVNQTIS